MWVTSVSINYRRASCQLPRDDATFLIPFASLNSSCSRCWVKYARSMRIYYTSVYIFTINNISLVIIPMLSLAVWYGFCCCFFIGLNKSPAKCVYMRTTCKAKARPKMVKMKAFFRSQSHQSMVFFDCFTFCFLEKPKPS